MERILEFFNVKFNILDCNNLAEFNFTIYLFIIIF